MRLIDADAFGDVLKYYDDLYDIQDIKTALDEIAPIIDAVEIDRVLECISFAMAYCTRGMSAIEETDYLSAIEDFVTVLRQKITNLKRGNRNDDRN